MKKRWITGNQFTLLENGEAFFSRIFESIGKARSEILLETFIIFEDKVGMALHAALIAAANRGVEVDFTIDGWGSRDLSQEFITGLARAGVRIHIFDPTPTWIPRHANLFRRMHRKLVVVDAERAFVGGINYSADHLADFGPEAKQDYSVEAEGPIVPEIHHFMRTSIAEGNSGRRWYKRQTRGQTRPQTRPPVTAFPPPAGEAKAVFVWRDNRDHTNDIERQYRLAIRLARHRVIIANAYFFPGYAFLKELRKAARRGVEVSLILQGNPDMPIVQTAASMLYHHLLRGGVRIYEYCDRPLHGKIALVDDEWATVGSSNLDPLSLSLNLEANLMIFDRGFNQQVNDSLQRLMQHSCKKIEAQDLKESSTWRLIRSFFLFHVLRRYPSWVGWLPAHVPRLALARPATRAEQQERIAAQADT